jgi:hypothetical protein
MEPEFGRLGVLGVPHSSNFPVDQRFDARDEFAADWFLRDSVRGVGDCEAGTRVAPPPKPLDFAGFGRVNDPRVSDEGEGERLNDFNEDQN